MINQNGFLKFLLNQIDMADVENKLIFHIDATNREKVTFTLLYFFYYPIACSTLVERLMNE